MVDNSEPNSWKDIDRKRGILTKADREYLLGEKSLDGQDEINTRYRIRQRVINSILDINLITRFLRKEDRTQIANDERVANRSTWENVTILAYELVSKNSNISEPVEIFEKGVAKAVGRNMTSPDSMRVKVDVDIDIEFEESMTNDELAAQIISAAHAMDMPTDEVLESFREDLIDAINLAEMVEERDS